MNEPDFGAAESVVKLSGIDVIERHEVLFAAK
jgi:hypothetical protein